MRVRMKVNITGSRNGEPWPAPGKLLDVPENEAADLIANGYAAAVTSDEHEEPDGTVEDTPADDEPQAVTDDSETPDGEHSEDTPADAGEVSAESTKPTSRRRKS